MAANHSTLVHPQEVDRGLRPVERVRHCDQVARRRGGADEPHRLRAALGKAMRDDLLARAEELVCVRRVWLARPLHRACEARLVRGIVVRHVLLVEPCHFFQDVEAVQWAWAICAVGQNKMRAGVKADYIVPPGIPRGIHITMS